MTTIAQFIATHGVDLSWQKPIYEHLHAHPELSHNENATAAYIAQRLRTFNCEITTGIGGYGIVAVFRNGDGPRVLMRSDMDGLPVEEQTSVAYASRMHATGKDGNDTAVMHACGHDMHMTGLLGACAILNERRDVWSGTFIAVFQPAEEDSTGALCMVDDHLADITGPVDVCLGQHIVPGPAGTVYTMPGAALAACDTLTITIHGRSAHGSMPHYSIDPTFIAAMIVIRLQAIISRETSPEDFAVISVGTLSAGHTNNTIPADATLVLNCRFYDDDVKKRTYAAIERIVTAECLASGCEQPADIVWSAHGELTDNDPDVFATIRPVFDDVFGDNSRTATRWTASEDFPFIPQALGAPYLFWTVGITPRTTWEQAEKNNTIARDIPVNHSGTFLPDFGPSVNACTNAATAAVLAYLHKK